MYLNGFKLDVDPVNPNKYYIWTDRIEFEFYDCKTFIGVYQNGCNYCELPVYGDGMKLSQLTEFVEQALRNQGA